MSGLRGRSAVAADHRSVLPHVPGIPWWAAAMVASTLTAIGVAYDAGTGSNALSGVFAVCYVLGCVAAIAVVRQSGVFTTVIQPPLILFIAVPLAYFVFHGSTFTGIKDTLINYGYPLIERFPLMFFTTATVLLIGMVRWFLGAAARRAAPADAETVLDAPLEAAEPTADEAAAAVPRRSTRSPTARASRVASAPAAAGAMEDEVRRTPRRSPGTAATGSKRSRHSRPPETEVIEPIPNRPRRRNTPPVDPPAEPRRRSRAGEPRERRPLPPLERRAPAERADRPDRYDRPQRRPRAADYEPYEPPPPSRTNAGGGTHHPVSRVRYRGSDDGESRVEQRTRPRPSRHAAPDYWE